VQESLAPVGRRAGSVRDWWRDHFSNVDKRERAGYGLWGAVGVIIAIPELWAAVAKGSPWPTISGTVGHLEDLWPGTAIFVVAVIVIAAGQALKAAWGRRPEVEDIARTKGGRMTRRPGAEPSADRDAIGGWQYAYLLAALLAVIIPSVAFYIVTLSTSPSQETKWILGYIIYGLIGLFCIVVPSILAYWWRTDVPFPTLFAALASLQQRVHFVALIVLAGLVVLLIHLALYPWPDVSHQAPTPGSP
jgi:hypothetical protein